MSIKSFADKHNVKPSPFTFVTPDHFEYTKPATLATLNGIDAVYKLNAIYVNKKGQFGDEPVFVTDNELVNAPRHMMDSVNDILNDSESINLILDGQVYFKIYEYKNAKGNQHGITWVDAPQL